MCRGSSKIELWPALKSCVRVVATLKQPTIPEIYALLPDRNSITPTAANQRVRRLVKLNLLRRVAKSSPARYELVD